jgi:hypothetical protein
MLEIMIGLNKWYDALVYYKRGIYLMLFFFFTAMIGNVVFGLNAFITNGIVMILMVVDCIWWASYTKNHPYI